MNYELRIGFIPCQWDKVIQPGNLPISFKMLPGTQACGDEEATLFSVVGYAQVIKATGAASMKDMGRVMKEVQAKTAGAADNQVVSRLVKERLSKA